MEIDVPVELAQTLISFYYKTLKQKLSNLESVNIKVENLGTFYIKEKALINQIEKLTTYSSRLNDSDIRQYSTKIEISVKINKMKNVVKMLLEEKQRRREVINKRFNNELKS